jgi:polyisoprenoid-binding protein YceI
MGVKFPNLTTLAAVGFALLFLAAPAWPQPPAPTAVSEIVLTLDPTQSTVHWTVGGSMHTVHGSFALKSGTIHFDPQTGKAGGEIIVSATSGQSGNGSRDARMHREILETAKYPEVVFRPANIEGKVDPSGPSDVKLSGVFSIHGANHDLTAQVHAQLSRGHWSGTASFDVPYVQWGIKNPSNFFLKVKPVVNVEVEMSGTIQTPN